jgi:hypothetical protein
LVADREADALRVLSADGIVEREGKHEAYHAMLHRLKGECGVAWACARAGRDAARAPEWQWQDETTRWRTQDEKTAEKFTGGNALELVAYQAGAVVSREIVKNKTGRRKIKRELKTVRSMITIYCRRNHGSVVVTRRLRKNPAKDEFGEE